MTAFPKYPAYKDSGVEWLGEVPEHWEANRVFSIFNERVETGHSQLPILNITIRNGVQMEQFEGERKKRLIEDRDAYKRAAAGDIAYNTMRMWQGAVGDVPVDGLVSPAYVVARPIKSINSRYYSYLFRGETFQVETNRHSYGIVSDRNRLYWLGFKNIVVPIPPRAEQDRIVAFLDEKTAQIDALIAKKQRQIELLDEQKAILINRAVTRGLHPNPDLQDSGIPWIGPIPKRWKVKRMRYLCHIGTGECDTKDSVPNGEYPFFVRSQTPERIKSFAYDCEAILTAGDGAGVGKVFHHFTGKFDCHQRVYVLRNFQHVTGRFLYFYMRDSFHRVALTGEAKSTVDSLRRPMLTDFPVPLPCIDEQDQIVSRCDEVEQRCDELVAKVESQIQTLQTLRSTLIAHAVTGKIKVA